MFRLAGSQEDTVFIPSIHPDRHFGLARRAPAWPRPCWPRRWRPTDGLRLEISGQGRVTALRIGQTVLPMKGQGGFALADFHRQPKPLNLVRNPGFEEGTKGWHLAAGQSLDTHVFHSGGASVRLEVPGPKPGMSNLGTVVAVKPNTRYRVGVSVRQEKAGGWGAYSSEQDDQGRPTAGQVGPYVPPEQRKDGVWLPLCAGRSPPGRRPPACRCGPTSTTPPARYGWTISSSTEFNEGVYEPLPGRVTAEGKQCTEVRRLAAGARAGGGRHAAGRGGVHPRRRHGAGHHRPGPCRRPCGSPCRWTWRAGRGGTTPKSGRQSSPASPTATPTSAFPGSASARSIRGWPSAGRPP